MQFHGRDAELLSLGERVAIWARRHGLSAKQIATRAKIDVRTARSVFEGNCGVRTYDALAAAYKWPFIEQVMTAVVGADPLQAREQELHARQAQAAAVHARLQRERDVRRALDGCALSVVDGEGRLRPASVGVEPRAFGNPSDAGDDR